jgi:hypothetical protein
MPVVSSGDVDGLLTVAPQVDSTRCIKCTSGSAAVQRIWSCELMHSTATTVKSSARSVAKWLTEVNRNAAGPMGAADARLVVKFGSEPTPDLMNRVSRTGPGRGRPERR